jgi:hypothetical protein
VVEDNEAETTSPWAAAPKGGKTPVAALQKGKQGLRPTPAPLAVKVPPRQSKNEVVADRKAEKKVITVSSSNPPTTPMLGFGDSAKARAKEADVQAARKQTAKGKAPSIDKTKAKVQPKQIETKKAQGKGALLSRKKK